MPHTDIQCRHLDTCHTVLHARLGYNDEYCCILGIKTHAPVADPDFWFHKKFTSELIEDQN